MIHSSKYTLNILINFFLIMCYIVSLLRPNTVKNKYVPLL